VTTSSSRMTLFPRTVRIRRDMFSSRRGDRNVSDCGFNSSIMPIQVSIIVPDSRKVVCEGRVDEYEQTYYYF
jgi:hypothetical protein